MTRYVFSERGDVLIRKEKAVPRCGKDFCDTCGDCLACYGGDKCFEKPFHYWVTYEAVPERKEKS